MVAEDPNYRAWCSLQRQPEWSPQKLRSVSQTRTDDQYCNKFADNLLENYVTFDSKFSPDMWAGIPSEEKKTNNDTEWHCTLQESTLR